MRFVNIFILTLLSVLSFAQSPGLSIRLNMKDSETANKKYLIEMKICTPLQLSERGSWFSKDTSSIRYNSLQADEIECGNYMFNGEGVELLNEKEESKKNNIYSFSNQVFAWEKIIVFQIKDISIEESVLPMYIALPVKYKSFITKIEFNDIQFKPGMAFLLEKQYAVFENDRLTMKPDFEDFSKNAVIEPRQIDWLQ